MRTMASGARLAATETTPSAPRLIMGTTWSSLPDQIWKSGPQRARVWESREKFPLASLTPLMLGCWERTR